MRYYYWLRCPQLQCYQAVSSATDETAWQTSANNISFLETKELASDNELPPEFYSNVRLSCEKQSFRTRTLDPFNIIPLIDDIYTDVCAVNMPFGQISSGYLRLDGYRDAIKSKVEGSIFPVPMTNSVYFVDRSGIYANTGKLFYIENFPESIKISKDILGNRSYTLKSWGVPVKYNGSQPYIDTHGLNISNNKEWLSGVFVGGKAFVLDRTTHSNFIFVGGNFQYNTGGQPHPRTTITDNGKFVAVSQNDQAPRIYGTDCATSSCNVNLFELTFKQGIEDAHYMRLQFKSNSHLRAFIQGKYQDVSKLKQFEIFPNNQYKTEYLEQGVNRKYLAMGDSFASGEGAFNYRDGTDHADNRCHQSLVAYPELISSEISLGEHGSIACSGATLNDIIYKNPAFSDEGELEEFYNSEDAQAKGKAHKDFNDEIYGNLLPGYRQQINHVRKYRSSIITIGISGNDIGFSDKIRACSGLGSCYDSPSERANIFEEIKSQFQPLRLRLDEIKKAAEDAKIYVTGYPQLFPDGGGSDCNVNVPFDLQERRLANDIVTDLNRMIKNVAESVGVTYINVQGSMAGNRLCDSGSKAFNGLTAGNDALVAIGYPIGKESFHPNQLGHQLFKNVILNTTNNFQVDNPEPNPNVTENNISSALTSTLSEEDIASIGNSPFARHNDDIVPDIVYIQGNQNGILLTFDEKELQPGEEYEGVIESTPTSLGVFTANEDGAANVDFPISNSIEPGFHTIHVIGPNAAGEQIDLYKVVYVASSENDWDGDGVVNENEKCLIGEPANQDYDQDGVDDACDGNISEPPAQSSGSSSGSNTPPGTISGVNNNPAGATQGQQNGGNLQPQGAQTQTTATNIQTGSAFGSAQGRNDSTEKLLNQGFNQSNLQVITAPYSTSSTASVNAPNFVAPPSSDGGGPGLALLIIGGVIVVLSVATWNKYIKTPVPARNKHK